MCCVKFPAKSQETVSGGKNGRVQDNKSGALRGAGRDEDELSKWKTTRNCACPLWNLRFSLAFEIAFLLCGERSPSDVPTFKMRLRDAHKNCVSELIRSCVSGFANLRNFAFLCRTERFESRRCLATVTVSKGRYPTGSLDYQTARWTRHLLPACSRRRMKLR